MDPMKGACRDSRQAVSGVPPRGVPASSVAVIAATGLPVENASALAMAADVSQTWLIATFAAPGHWRTSVCAIDRASLAPAS